MCVINLKKNTMCVGMCVYVYKCDKTKRGCVCVCVCACPHRDRVCGDSVYLCPFVSLPLPPRASVLNYNQFGSNRKRERKKRCVAKHIRPLA